MSSLTSLNCRICFISCDETEKNASEIADIYFEATGYEIFNADVPQKICQECYTQLMVVKEFRSICENSEKYLEEQRQKNVFLLPEYKIKVEDSVEGSKNEEEKYQPFPKKIVVRSRALKITSLYKSSKKPIQSIRHPTFFVNWNYQAFRDYLTKKSIRVSPFHSFVLNYDKNRINPAFLPKNKDPTIYHEITIQENVLTCTYCQFTQEANRSSVGLMQAHCDSLDSHKIGFQCFDRKCKATFPCLDLLRRHNFSAHQKQVVLLRPIQCNFCQFSCFFESNMGNHWKKMHGKQKKVKCERCKSEFLCDDLKFQHIVFQCHSGLDPDLVSALKLSFKCIFESKEDKLENGEHEPMTDIKELKSLEPCPDQEPTLTDLLGIKHSCDFCFFQTQFPKELQIHMKICKKTSNKEDSSEQLKKDQTVVCELCAKEIKTCYLRKHLKTHRPELFQCDHCDKKYQCKKNLQEHIEIFHLGIYNNICKYCGSNFKYDSCLTKHIKRKHTKMDYVCEFCGKTFISQSSLKYHRASHTDEQKVSCPKCHKAFNSHVHLRRHLINLHSNKSFPCETCGKTFKNEKYRRQHRASHGPNTYFCPVCPNNYSGSTSLRKHVAEKHPGFAMPALGTSLKNIKINESLK